MLKHIIVISTLVAVLAVLYPHVTTSRFLGFGAYMTGGGGGASTYDTVLACHAYLNTSSPASFKVKLDCFGPATGIVFKGIASFLAGGEMEKLAIGALELWLSQRGKS